MEKNRVGKRLGFILILLCNLEVSAQTGLQYLPCQVCPVNTPAQNFKINSTTDDVVSDFGRRNAPGASAWHRGTDLTLSGVNDYGYHLLSPVSGTISQLAVNYMGYKYIVIDGPGNQNIGFGHIFNDNNIPITVGDLVLQKCNNSNYYAIINLTTHKAIGPVNGLIVTYNNVNYTVSNQVQAGEVIAPLGTSGNAPSHVHVYRPVNPAIDPQSLTNAKDPMEILTHYPTNYQNAFTNFYNIAQATGSVNYPGGEYGSVIVQCQMQNPGILGNPPDQYYHSAVMDVDREDLYIRKKDDPAEAFDQWGSPASKYQLIKGPHVFSYISNGSRISSGSYPANLTGPDHGSYTNSGVYPFAYNEQPYDLYYFSDIVTRIHKNHVMGQSLLLAGISDDARYSDGDYGLFVKTTRVTGQQLANDASANNVIRIDNFRPYIKMVSAHTPLANPFYSDEWNWNGSTLTYNVLQNNPVAQGNDISIHITTSEPLEDLFLAVGTWSVTVDNPVGQTERKEWEIMVPSFVWHTGDNILRINGHDLAGNAVEGFTNTHPKPANSFPVRISETQWSPQPLQYEDVVHRIKVLDNSPLQADYYPMEITVNPGDYVSFYDLSTGGYIQAWQWEFEGGNPSGSNVQDPVIQFNTLGTHQVSLTIHNSSMYSTATGTVKVTNEVVPPHAIFSPFNVSISQYTTVHFIDLSEGSPTQWYWDFDGAAAPSLLQNPVVEFDQTGTYNVILTVMNDVGIDAVMGSITVVNEPALLDVMCSVNPFMAVPGTQVNFQGSVFNGVPPFLYSFDFGDGTIIPVTSSDIITSANHAYNLGGEYVLTVSVTDALNRMSCCTESVIIMGGNPCAGLTAEFTTDPGGGLYSVPLNTAVSFTSNSSGGTPPYLYHWTFSADPISGAQPSVNSYSEQGPFNVSFPQAGNYPVQLHISDMNGCGSTVDRNITVFQPQHCLVARINKMINGRMYVALGSNNFWDFTFVPWCGLCEDPPGSNNFPCETNNYWKLVTYPGNITLAQHYGFPFQMQGCFLNSSVEQLFQYQFNTEGTYKLSLKAWDEDCDVVSGYDCKDETSLLINAVDCNHLKEICNNNFVIQQGYNEDVFTGIISAGGPQCSMIIPSGAEIGFLAVQEVRMKEGFESQLGSEFNAGIQPCPASETTPLRLDHQSTGKLPVYDKWEVYPNPVSAWLSVRFFEDQSESYDLQVFNLLGDCVLTKNSLKGRAASLDLTPFPPGIYLLMYKGNSGPLSKRLIKR